MNTMVRVRDGTNLVEKGPGSHSALPSIIPPNDLKASQSSEAPPLKHSPTFQRAKLLRHGSGGGARDS